MGREKVAGKKAAYNGLDGVKISLICPFGNLDFNFLLLFILKVTCRKTGALRKVTEHLFEHWRECEDLKCFSVTAKN